MATLNSNRIPLPVNHDSTPGGSSSTYTAYRTTSSKAGDGIGGDTEFHSTYDMRNMNNETERIKNRMREFEERCRKWREDFFTRSHNINSSDIQSSSTNSMFDQRVPFQEPLTSPSFQHHSSANLGAASAATSSPPNFSSSMHKSYLDDLNDGSGGKVYKIEFEIGDFNQNELLITTNNRTLTVKGDRELKAGSATETKTFNREISLPDYVDLNKLNAYLLDKAPGPSSPNKSSPTHLVAQSNANNVLVIEAPVLMDKYSYRRSAFNPSQIGGASSSHQSQSQSPTRPNTTHTHTSRQFSPPRNTTSLTKTSVSPNKKTVSESYHTENKSTSSSTSTTHTTKVVNDNLNGNNFLQENRANSRIVPDYLIPDSRSYSQSNLNQAVAPELIQGYPVYDTIEGCVVYKFDLTGFDQSEIHLTITVDRTLEIKACKESTDHLGKIYREFKREIQLEPDVDANLIKNLLHEGILTLKIPKPNKADGVGSLSNAHNLNAPNGGFREFYNDSGKLAKLTTDFRGYNPENVKIILSANSVLKVTAQQNESISASNKNTVQKECTRQYTLPDWIQPENMKAIMSRDGILTVDFTNNNQKANAASTFDEPIIIN